MNIVLVVHKASGGMGRYVESLANSMSVKHNVIVLAPPETANAYNFSHVAWPSSPRDIPEIARIVRGADVVHAHGYRAGALAALWIRSFHSSARFFVTWHNELPQGRAHEYLAKMPLRYAQCVGAVSSDLMKQAERMGAKKTFYEQVPSPNVPQLYPQAQMRFSAWDGSDGTSFADAQRRAREKLGEICGASISSDTPLIVTIARYAPQKDIPTLIDTAALLPQNYQWVILGSGDADIAERLRKAHKNTSGARIIAGGHCSDVATALQAADLFVLTSLWEGHPLVIQEAFAAGVPVVATSGGGLVDMLSDSCGLLGGVGKSDELAAHIRSVVEGDSSCGSTLARAAYAKVQAKPHIDDMAQGWLDTYGQVGEEK